MLVVAERHDLGLNRQFLKHHLHLPAHLPRRMEKSIYELPLHYYLSVADWELIRVNTVICMFLGYGPLRELHWGQARFQFGFTVQFSLSDSHRGNLIEASFIKGCDFVFAALSNLSRIKQGTCGNIATKICFFM